MLYNMYTLRKGDVYKMKEIKVKLYSFDELSDDAKENAIEKARERNCAWYWDNVSEEINALSDIAYTMGADKNVRYEFSTCSPSYIEFSFGDIADGLKDIRALKYIYNNFISPFVKGKYYSTNGEYINGKYHYKYKYSKAIKEFSSVSGMYIDFVIHDVYLEYIDKAKRHISFDVDDFIDDVEDRLCKTILEAAEEYDSKENWRERLLDNEDEIYNEDGTIYRR